MAKDIASYEDQIRSPNYIDEKGKLILRRCFNCDPKYGRENYILYEDSGVCVWCGWMIEYNVKIYTEEE